MESFINHNLNPQVGKKTLKTVKVELLQMDVLTLCSSLSARDELGCPATSLPRLLPSVILGIKGPPNGSEKLRIMCRIWSLWARNGSLWRGGGEGEEKVNLCKLQRGKENVPSPHCTPRFSDFYHWCQLGAHNRQILGWTQHIEIQSTLNMISSWVKCGHSNSAGVHSFNKSMWLCHIV